MDAKFMKWLSILVLLGAMGASAQTVKKVSRAEAMSAAITRIQPQYPAMARQLKIEGTVELEATVSETGAVEEVAIVSGNPLFTKPAAETVKKWKFTPFLQDGKPVRASAPISIVFRREQ